MNDRNKIMAAGIAAGVFFFLGGVVPGYGSVCHALAVFPALLLGAFVLKYFVRRFDELERTLADLPKESTKLAASELHSMATILRRFPECSMQTTGWSMRFANLHTILDLLDSHCPSSIVECGSGISTLMVAAWLRERGVGHVVSFEHDAKWADVTRSILQREGLTDWATVVVAPLASIDAFGRRIMWYDIQEVKSVVSDNIELVIVDGPPSVVAGNALNRLGAMHVLAENCADDCVIVLDDAFRRGEREVVVTWQQVWKDLELEWRGETTGMAVLHRKRRHSIATS